MIRSVMMTRSPVSARYGTVSAALKPGDMEGDVNLWRGNEKTVTRCFDGSMVQKAIRSAFRISISVQQPGCVRDVENGGGRRKPVPEAAESHYGFHQLWARSPANMVWMLSVIRRTWAYGPA